MSLLTRATKALKKNEEKPKKTSVKKTEKVSDTPDTSKKTGAVKTMAETIELTNMLTEKGMFAQEQNVGVFRVKPKATKGQIRQAVLEKFGVRALSIRTARFQGKRRRRGAATGMTNSWKKAFVKVEDISKIASEEE